MKRTTYIIVGVLLAGLVVMSGFIFYMSTCVTTWEDTLYEIGGEQKTIQLPACKSVEFVMKRGEGDLYKRVDFTDIPLQICPTDSAVGSLTFAADLEKFMTVHQSGDTLYVEFKFESKDLDSSYQKLQWLRVRSAAMQLNVPVGVQRIGADVVDLRGTFSGFHCDTLSVWMNDYAEFRDCRIASLDASGREVRLESGEIGDLYLNLDAVRTWNVNVDSCRIGTEHLKGSGAHYSNFQKGECRQVLWTPLEDDASLRLQFNHAARVEVNE